MTERIDVRRKEELEQELSVFFATGKDQLSIRSELGSFESRRTIFSDFSLSTRKFNNGRQTLAIPVHRHEPCITMIFQFGGLSAYRDRFNPFLLPHRHHSINYFNRYDCKSLIDEMGVQHEVNIILEESFFRETLQSIADSGNELSERALNKVEFNTINDRQPMDAGIHGVVQNIVACPFDGPLKETYLNAQIKALMHLQFWHFNERATGKRMIDDNKLNTRDIDILQDVKAFLDLNFLEPASVLTLSRRFGINEFKLKYGFRKLFNASPIKYLLDLRMNHAAMILRSTDCQVADIARVTGYSSPNNFTIAFRKHFGVPPLQYRARR